jgi:hypothetical protein
LERLAAGQALLRRINAVLLPVVAVDEHMIDARSLRWSPSDG